MAFYATGLCVLCRQPFVFHPQLVPSHPWPPPDGPKEPICETCMTQVNRLRVEQGQPPWPVPDGAYQPADGFPG